MALRFLFLLITFFGVLHAWELRPVVEPLPLAGSHFLEEAGIATFLKRLPLENPEGYHRLESLESQLREFNKNNVLQQQFWAVEIHPGTPVQDSDFYTTTATLRQEGSNIRIWVEDDSWSSGYVTQTEVDNIYNALAVATPSGSADPLQGIVQLERSHFGDPPNRAGDGIINFLLLDIRDGFDPDNGITSFIAGYFFSRDQLDTQYSNRMDLMYLDAYPGIQQPSGSRNPDGVLGTTAHELQHLIHYHYDRNEETWVNEGLSEIAAKICGYGLGNPGLYLDNPGVSLVEWNSELADYSRVGLWTFYLYEQYGARFIRTLTQNTAVGINGVNRTFQATGLTQTFDEALFSWFMANLVNDYAANSSLGYLDPELRNLRISKVPLSNFPTLIEETISPYSAAYYRFKGADTLFLDFFTELPNTIVFSRSATGTSTSLFPEGISEYALAGFNPDDDFYLIQPNLAGTAPLTLCAWAPQSLLGETLAHDDEEVDFFISTSGMAANRFSMPFSGGQITHLRFVNALSSGTQTLRLRGNAGGQPGGDLISPVQLTGEGRGNWVEVALEQPVTSLAAGDIFYVVLESTVLAYDQDNNPEGASLFNRNNDGWRALNEFTLSGSDQPLDGSWMLQARVEGGLTVSGPRDCNASPPSEIALLMAFPNPATETLPRIITSVTKAGEMQLRVYNALGQRVGEMRELLNGPGKNFRFNLSEIDNSAVANLASGVYFVRGTFRAGDGQELSTNTLRFVLVK